MTEARHGLLDAVEAYRATACRPPRRSAGRWSSSAATRAGAVLAGRAGGRRARSLGLRMTAVVAVLAIAGDLTWQGRAGVGPHPPAGYLLLSNAVDVLGLALALGGRRSARSACG